MGESDDTGDFGLQAYEIETRWMLTDQGELWADWGLLFELERQHKEDIYKFTSGLLFETEFKLKYRYRYLPALHPSIEIYSGEDFVGLGPGFIGVDRYEGQKQLK